MTGHYHEVITRCPAGAPALLGGSPGGFGGSWPSVEVNASENDVRVAAELPGMDEKDIEVFVDNLTRDRAGQPLQSLIDKRKGY